MAMLARRIVEFIAVGSTDTSSEEAKRRTMFLVQGRSLACTTEQQKRQKRPLRLAESRGTKPGFARRLSVCVCVGWWWWLCGVLVPGSEPARAALARRCTRWSNGTYGGYGVILCCAEFMDGGTLKKVVSRQMIDVSRRLYSCADAFRWGLQVAEGKESALGRTARLWGWGVGL